MNIFTFHIEKKLVESGEFFDDFNDDGFEKNYSFIKKLEKHSKKHILQSLTEEKTPLLQQKRKDFKNTGEEDMRNSI